MLFATRELQPSEVQSWSSSATSNGVDQQLFRVEAFRMNRYIRMTRPLFASSLVGQSRAASGGSNRTVISDDMKRNRKSLAAALQYQEEQRIIRHKAFLDWQAGQREKGAAHRLRRLARIAENNKKRHYHGQRGRLLVVSPSITINKVEHNKSKSIQKQKEDIILWV
eukprot:gene6479-4666_t